MKQKLYIETSVVSYLTAKRSRDLLIAARQEATSELWTKLHSSSFSGYVSTLVHQEAQALAEQILDAKAVPSEYPDDALHMAVAAVNGMEIEP